MGVLRNRGCVYIPPCFEDVCIHVPCFEDVCIHVPCFEDVCIHVPCFEDVCIHVPCFECGSEGKAYEQCLSKLVSLKEYRPSSHTVPCAHVMNRKWIVTLTVARSLQTRHIVKGDDRQLQPRLVGSVMPHCVGGNHRRRVPGRQRCARVGIHAESREIGA
jgi:hypothetical protein